MKDVMAPGGLLVVLDYNHEDNAWEPEPPGAFRCFYAAFLEWRRANGWNNRMADRLSELFRSQGLTEIVEHVDDEVARRGDPDFDAAAGIWTRVVESLGPALVTAGFLTAGECAEAEAVYREWVRDRLQTQVLRLKTVQGRGRP
jgi:hypothetical protein